jgi:hypothetical protein
MGSKKNYNFISFDGAEIYYCNLLVYTSFQLTV